MKYTEAIFFKQHSETVMVWNYQNADCSLRNKFIVLFVIIFDFFRSYSNYSNINGNSKRANYIALPKLFD